MAKNQPLEPAETAMIQALAFAQIQIAWRHAFNALKSEGVNLCIKRQCFCQIALRTITDMINAVENQDLIWDEVENG